MHCEPTIPVAIMQCPEAWRILSLVTDKYYISVKGPRSLTGALGIGCKWLARVLILVVLLPVAASLCACLRD